jgi:transposase
MIKDIRFATPPAPRHQLVLYAQSLDEVVAQDAPVRDFARLLAELDWSAWEQAYAGFGQPPIHPRYLAGALLFGLMNRLRSSRELEMAARKHLDFIWLLEGFAPDHSTFAKFRAEHTEAIRDLQGQIARALVGRRKEGLLELIIDGTRLRADSGRDGVRTAKTIERTVEELERRLGEMQRNDGETLAQTGCLAGLEAPAEEADKVAWVNRQIARLERQREKYQKALETARRRDQQARKHNGEKTAPVRVPVSDPDAQLAPNKEGGFAPNYTPVATIDARTGAIVHAEVLADSNEAGAVLPAVAAAQQLTGEKTSAVLADGNFAAGPVLAALDRQEIQAYMPTRSASPPDNPALRPDPALPVAEEDKARLPRQGGHFARTAFVYDALNNTYYCPAGHSMTPCKHGKKETGAAYTQYQCAACVACPWAADCIKGKTPYRAILRDEYEALREATDERMASEAGKAIYKKRAPGIEGVFARIKSCMGIRRFARRGLDKVRCDWNWICTAYNLKKLLNIRKAASGTPEGNRPERLAQTTAQRCWRPMRRSGACLAECERLCAKKPRAERIIRQKMQWRLGAA